MHAYNRVKEFARLKLLALCQRMESHGNDAKIEPLIEELGNVQVFEELSRQIDVFWRGEYPFDAPVTDGDPLRWWSNLKQHPQARALAVGPIACRENYRS